MLHRLPLFKNHTVSTCYMEDLLFKSPSFPHLSSSKCLIARLALNISIPNWGIVLSCSLIIYVCPCWQWVMKTSIYACGEVLQESYQFTEGKKCFKVTQINQFKFYLDSFYHVLTSSSKMNELLKIDNGNAHLTYTFVPYRSLKYMYF